MTESYTIREGTAADAETIVRHRREMFFDMGKQDLAVLEEMVESSDRGSRRKYPSVSI